MTIQLSLVARIVILICAVLCGNTWSIAGLFQSYTPSRHDRFLPGDTPNPGFFVDETQLSGVALNRAVLISPQHYVSAAHVTAGSATFRGTDGVLRTYNSASSQTLQTLVTGEGNVNSDVRVHTLAAPVDSSILPVPLVVGSALDFIGQEIIVFDQGSRAGRNIIEDISIVEFEAGNGDTITIRYTRDTDTNSGSGGLGDDEVGLVGGDSGNSALMLVNGQIGVIGAHMGIYVPPGTTMADPYSSFSSFLSPYANQLDTIVGSQGYSLSLLSVTAVPEPSGFGLMLMVTTGLLVRSRRRPLENGERISL